MSTPPESVDPAGLHVSVDRVIYQHLDHAPPDRPHCFVYFISIHNHTKANITIKGRKWVVTNGQGEITVLEGDGVVGQFPEISPNDKFSYNSFHLIDTLTASAEGSYLGIDEAGLRVIARIPRFTMRVPEAHST
ncbi:MAG: ApaG domain [Pedosphaera sp.]|nr:ApaG domain [Pedosphaera sp.]